jgi:hypothetical protein
LALVLESVRPDDEQLAEEALPARDEMKSSLRSIAPTVTAEEILFELGILP